MSDLVDAYEIAYYGNESISAIKEPEFIWTKATNIEEVENGTEIILQDGAHLAFINYYTNRNVPLSTIFSLTKLLTRPIVMDNGIRDAFTQETTKMILYKKKLETESYIDYHLINRGNTWYIKIYSQSPDIYKINCELVDVMGSFFKFRSYKEPSINGNGDVYLLGLDDSKVGMEVAVPSSVNITHLDMAIKTLVAELNARKGLYPNMGI